MSYTYLSTESDADGTGKQPDEASLETTSLSANESSLPFHHGRRPTVWIAVAVGAVAFLVGLSLFAFSSTTRPNGSMPEEPEQPKRNSQRETTRENKPERNEN